MIVQAFNAFSENTVLLPDGAGGVVVVDPGFSTQQEWKWFDEVLSSRGWEPRAVLLTHAHLDHVMGCHGMQRRFGLKPMLHAFDEPTYAMAPRAADLYGISLDPLPDLHENRLEPGSTLAFGALRLEVRFTPGHAPGHVVFIDSEAERIIGGDVLFKGSIGRTDLPGGDAPTLARSIGEVLYAFPDHFEVIPGHGPTTTIGAEKRTNPFVNAAGTGMLQQD